MQRFPAQNYYLIASLSTCFPQHLVGSFINCYNILGLSRKKWRGDKISGNAGMERGYAQVLRAHLRHMHCTAFVEEK